MSGPENGTPTGDSTPDLGFLREHDDGSRTRWPVDPEHDSATDMLPPEDESLELMPESESTEIGFDANDSGSSIHRLAAVPSGAHETGAPDASGDAAPATLDEAHELVDADVDEAGSGETAREDPAFEDAVETAAQVAGAINAAPLPAAGPPEITVQSAPAGPRGNNLFVVALASYASAVTIALLYLLFQRATANPSLLESLPDVAPLREGEVLRWVPVDAEMPPGHSLALGESQRFGNVQVTPLRVVREPLAFAHYSGRDDSTRPRTEPVLKLWVRFTNESDDQSIAPLDGQLLFTRVYRPETGETRANQFVCALDTKQAGGEPVFVYDHSPKADFDLVDQQLGHALQPGESYETYIPTTEERLDSLSGELVWRVHFRKGYSPQGHGVTTVVEVRFDTSRIESSSAAG